MLDVLDRRMRLAAAISIFKMNVTFLEGVIESNSQQVTRRSSIITQPFLICQEKGSCYSLKYGKIEMIGDAD